MRPSRFRKDARRVEGAYPRPNQYFLSSFWIVILSPLASAAATGGAILSVRDSYLDAIARTERNLRNLTLVLSEQTDRAIQSLEVIQDDIIGRLFQNGTQTADDLRRIGSQQKIHELLALTVEGLPQADAIALVDATGQGLATSRQWPLAGDQDLSTRDYYLALAVFKSPDFRQRGDGLCTDFMRTGGR